MSNREDIIRMAREAGFGVIVFNLDDYDWMVEIPCATKTNRTELLERFAALVAAEKDAEIQRLRSAGCHAYVVLSKMKNNEAAEIAADLLREVVWGEK